MTHNSCHEEQSSIFKFYITKQANTNSLGSYLYIRTIRQCGIINSKGSTILPYLSAAISLWRCLPLLALPFELMPHCIVCLCGNRAQTLQRRAHILPCVCLSICFHKWLDVRMCSHFIPRNSSICVDLFGFNYNASPVTAPRMECGPDLHTDRSRDVKESNA